MSSIHSRHRPYAPAVGGVLSDLGGYLNSLGIVPRPEPPARYCVACNGKLSRYNATDRCLRHPAVEAMGESGHRFCAACGVTAIGASSGIRMCPLCVRAGRKPEVGR